jgi:hypothetical protein
MIPDIEIVVALLPEVLSLADQSINRRDTPASRT